MQPFTYKYAGIMLKAYRQAFSMVRCGGTIKMHWNSEPLNLAGFRKEFTDALDKRINSKAGIRFHFRRCTEQYETELQRDAWDIQQHNNSRIALHSFRTAEARQRFSHLLSH